MRLNFTKMHGLGNDFVVLDGIHQNIDLSPDRIRFLADRHFGVGCDQILLVEVSHQPKVDFRYRIFNADGAEVGQCGNGARCFARFVRDKELTAKRTIDVETKSGLLQLQVEDDDRITVDMGVPILDPKQIPFQVPATEVAPSYELEVDGNIVAIGAVSMGNPHAVLTVDEVAQAPVSTLGTLIESHPRFPQRTNVGFMQIISPDHIRLRVFERGVGETLACGSGACAAVVVGKLQGFLAEQVQVDLPGGSLSIRWPAPEHSVLMTGPATPVFDGKIQL